nr:hypothetical protein [Asgard group archaeon]
MMRFPANDHLPLRHVFAESFFLFFKKKCGLKYQIFIGFFVRKLILLEGLCSYLQLFYRGYGMNNRRIQSIIVLVFLFGMTFLITNKLTISSTQIKSSQLSIEQPDPITSIGINAVLDDVTEFGFIDENYGTFRDIYVTDSVAFIASDLNGLIALDISDPSSPVFLGQCELPGRQVCNYLDVEGDVAVLSCAYDGVVTVDISDPTNMYILDRYDVTNAVQEIRVENNIVYAAYTLDGLRILNITNPADIKFEGSYYSGSGQIQYLEKYGSYILTSNIVTNALDIINVTDVSTPTFVASYNPGSSINEIAIKGTYAYLILSNGYTYIIDLSTITSPSYSSQFVTSGYEILIDDDVLAIATYSNVRFYNVSNPAAPTFIVNYPVESGGAYFLSLNETTLAVSQLNNGL